MSVRKMRIGCDFCAEPGVPTWRYDVPKEVPISIIDMQATFSAGEMGACDECDGIIQSGDAVDRLADRMLAHPKLQGMSPEGRIRVRSTIRSNFRRYVHLLTNRRVNVQGSHPMDGLGAFDE